jgi:nitrogen-specific signal transduction histidine kinase
LPTDTLRGEKNQSTSPTNHKPFQQIVKLGRAKAHKSRRPLGGTRGTWAK